MEKLTPYQVKAIANVAAFATLAHHGQVRRGDARVSKIVHPARVATITAIFGGDYLAVMGSWGHDIEEDTRLGPKFRRFVMDMGLPGDDAVTVIGIVEALTKDLRIRPRAARNQAAIQAVLDGPYQATLVKLADRIDNLTETKFETLGKQYGGLPVEEFVVLYYNESRQLLDGLKNRANQYGYSDAWGILRDLIERR
jgi:(p)ppGpp synthase/HD superfamily hydrolase